MSIQNLDILLVNVPFISTAYPPAGTSALKGAVQQHGFSAKVLDFNLQLFTKKFSQDTLSALENYYTINTDINLATTQIVENFYQDCVQQIKNYNPKWLGISVFTFQCQRATTDLCKIIRALCPDIKIVIGGAGISTSGIASHKADFGDTLKEKNLIDHYIKGDGEVSLVELLQDNTDYPGIDKPVYKVIEDLDALAFPDYEDVIDLPYEYHNSIKLLPITGSRGCVRHCTFCDIHAFWKKFAFRSGKNIAQEMISLYEKHNIKNFFFMDSLINGSMKAYRELCNVLVDYYESNNLEDKFFRWGGQFIIRSAKQMTEQDYVMAARSGCSGLCCGVESGSESVRNHMQKQFSNEDLDHTMQQFQKNGMTCYFFMITGYPTETAQDFQDTIDMFERYKKYSIDGTLFGVNLNGLLSVDDGTPLYAKSEELGLVPIIPASHVHGLNWQSQDNSQLTLEERIRRRIVLQETCMDLGYTVWNGDMQLKRIEASYDKIQNGTY